jgi:hypothetical protein
MHALYVLVFFLGNLSMQTMKISIWTIESISRGTGDWINFQSGPALGMENHTFTNSPPTLLRLSYWMLIGWHGDFGFHLIFSLFFPQFSIVGVLWVQPAALAPATDPASSLPPWTMVVAEL